VQLGQHTPSWRKVRALDNFTAIFTLGAQDFPLTCETRETKEKTLDDE
jgi:hypothetical protein